MRERRARIAAVRTIGPRILEIDAEAIEPPRVDTLPGQFVSIRLPGSAGHRRSYSIASAPGQTGRFTLLVRDSGGSGSAYLTSLSPGDEILYFGPMGYFLPEDRHEGDVVFAATGVGVSAIFPMMEEVVARPEPGHVRFFWGLEDEGDLFWSERLEALDRSARFSHAIYYAGRGQGFITPHVVATAQALDDPTYYLCGNGDMLRAVISGLVAAGVDRHSRIHIEAFNPPGV